MDKALIKVGYSCNNRCLFCHSEHNRAEHGDAPTERIEARIEEAWRRGIDMVVFSGGEPTIRRELPKLAKRVAKRGMALGLVTNGRLLSYAKARDYYLSLGLRYAFVSLHGADPSTYRAVTSIDGFSQVIAAVEGLLATGTVAVTLNAVVCRQNIDTLGDLVTLAADLARRFRCGGDRPELILKLSLLEPKGLSLEEEGFASTFVPIREAVDAIHEAIALGSSISGQGLKVVHDGIPRCLCPDFEAHNDDLWTHGYVAMAEAFEERLFPIDERNKRHDLVCIDCSARTECPGVYEVYVERDLAGPTLEPLVQPVANSMDFGRDGSLDFVHPSDCSLRAHWDELVDGGYLVEYRSEEGIKREFLGRLQLLVDGSQPVAVFSTDSIDFEPALMERIRHETGQVYRDVSDKEQLDDFRGDLRPTEMHATCRSCPHLAPCPGCLEVLDEDWFTRDDLLVVEEVRAIAGAVLDVGSAHGFYVGTIAEGIIEGRIHTYTALDPDAEALEKIRAKLTDVTTVSRPVEEAEFPPGSFDVVLALRSFNHFRHVRRALDNMVRWLKPGGRLVIADNVEFIVLRERAQIAAVRAGDEPMPEHFRNADQSTVRMHLTRYSSMRGEKLVSLSATTANQWLAVYRKDDTLT